MLKSSNLLLSTQRHFLQKVSLSTRTKQQLRYYRLQMDLSVSTFAYASTESSFQLSISRRLAYSRRSWPFCTTYVGTRGACRAKMQTDIDSIVSLKVRFKITDTRRGRACDRCLAATRYFQSSKVRVFVLLYLPYFAVSLRLEPFSSPLAQRFESASARFESLDFALHFYSPPTASSFRKSFRDRLLSSRLTPHVSGLVYRSMLKCWSGLASKYPLVFDLRWVQVCCNPRDLDYLC